MMYSETLLIDGGLKQAIDFVRGFFTGNVPGYIFYVDHTGVPVTKAEQIRCRRIPMALPDWAKSRIVSWMLGRPITVFSNHNLIPTASRTAIAKALSGGCASLAEIEINYQELGTGTNAPANGDTGLQTASAGTRKTVSSIGYSSNVISITAFWAAAEATGTWREFGLFINGTGSSNSGTLFNRVAINITVGAPDALTLDGTVTIS